MCLVPSDRALEYGSSKGSPVGGREQEKSCRERGRMNKSTDLLQQGRMIMPEKESKVGNRGLTFTCDYITKHAVRQNCRISQIFISIKTFINLVLAFD